MLRPSIPSQPVAVRFSGYLAAAVLLCFGTFAPSSALAQPAEVVYSTTALNLRSGPTVQSERLLTMPPGAVTYLVACESSAWCQLEYVTPMGYLVTGYAHSGYLSYLPPHARQPISPRITGAVMQGGHQSDHAGRVFVAPQGSVMMTLAESGTVSAQGFYDEVGVWHPLGVPSEPIAECRDGSYDTGMSTRTTCVGRAGVLRWLR
jgi:hypothetical protein